MVVDAANLSEEYLNSPDQWSCEPFAALYDKIEASFIGESGPTSYQKIIIIALYALVCNLGAVFNILIISAYCRNGELRTLPNYFIVNLATSDLLFCIFTGPTTLFMTMSVFWPLGNLGCVVAGTCQAVNILVSTFSLTAIGLHRFVLTRYPIKFQNSYRLPIFGILFIWTLAMVLCCPFAFALHAFPISEKVAWVPWGKNNSKFLHFLAKTCSLPEPVMCLENWKEIFLSQRTFSLAVFMLQYILPLFTLCLLYWNVATKARNQGRFRLKILRKDDSEGRKRVINSQRRTFILISSLVAAFAALWLPWNLYNTLVNFSIIKYSAFKEFVYVYLTGMLTTMVNPVLYGLFNENFRAVFRKYSSGLRSIRSNVTRNFREPDHGTETILETVPLQSRRCCTDGDDHRDRISLDED